MTRPASFSLSNRLDSEVYQAVTKLYPYQEGTTQSRPTVGLVSNQLRRSGSSLARKPKPVLEKSIERILNVLEEEQYFAGLEDESLSEKEREMRAVEGKRDTESPNLMNRSVVKGFPSRSTVFKNNIKASDTKASATKASDTKASDTRPDHLNSDNMDPEAATLDTKKRGNDRENGDGNGRVKKRQKHISSMSPPNHVSLGDIGGMDHIIEELTEFTLLPLLCPKMYTEDDMKIPRGILLHGPPGCGKTMLVEALASELELPFLSISAPSIVSSMSGESEKQLRSHFEQAMRMAPSLIFIDEIDVISPKREHAQRDMERRIVAQLATCMDDLAIEKSGGKPVMVLAATNRPDALDSALRRGGRFDKEIAIGVPKLETRQKILATKLRRMNIAEDVSCKELAKRTPGFVGADLESLVTTAGSVRNKRFMKQLKELSTDSQVAADERVENTDQDIEMVDNASYQAKGPSSSLVAFRAIKTFLKSNQLPAEFPGMGPLAMSDFEAALDYVQPSSKREGFSTIPDATWSSIGALHSIRKQLKLAIVDPIRSPEKFAHFGLKVTDGVLLWGPPGCGKTLLAKAVANESGANFISIKGPELLNKFVGESERAVRQLFDRAKTSEPTIIFFDELDSLVPKRNDSQSEAGSRVVNTLLTELDGVSDRSGVFVIASTNRPDVIDPAMKRSGRLGKHIFVDLPDADSRVEIMETISRGKPMSPGLDFAKTAMELEGYSGADLVSLVYEAATNAVTREAAYIEQCDMEAARAQVRPSVQDAGWYRKLADRMSRG